jgi:hypothetical protein
MLIEQFWTSNIWGLERLAQFFTISTAPIKRAISVNQAIRPFQDFLLAIEVPDYVFYQWGFYILALWEIVRAVVIVIKWLIS